MVVSNRSTSSSGGRRPVPGPSKTLKLRRFPSSSSKTSSGFTSGAKYLPRTMLNVVRTSSVSEWNSGEDSGGACCATSEQAIGRSSVSTPLCRTVVVLSLVLVFSRNLLRVINHQDVGGDLFRLRIEPEFL